MPLALYVSFIYGKKEGLGEGGVRRELGRTSAMHPAKTRGIRSRLGKFTYLDVSYFGEGGENIFFSLVSGGVCTPGLSRSGQSSEAEQPPPLPPSFLGATADQ